MDTFAVQPQIDRASVSTTRQTPIASSATPLRLARHRNTALSGHAFANISVDVDRRRDAPPASLRSFPYAAELAVALRPKQPLVAVLDPVGCRQRNVPGFTQGDVSHFLSPEVGLHVTAHEAVHQLQHRGETRDAYLGPESHANAVADLVVDGRSPRSLLGSWGRPVPASTRHYLKADKKGDINGKPGTRVARLSETGETLTWGGHEAFATDGMIRTANAVLRAKDSQISFYRTGTDIHVNPPGTPWVNVLHEVKVNFANGEWDDCGRMARDIMGPSGADKPAYARARPGGIAVRTPVLTGAKKSPVRHIALILEMDAEMQEAGGTDEEKKRAGDKARKDFEANVITDTETRDVIRKRSKKLKDADKTRMGIDEYVKPGVGEAYSIAPGWVDPGRYPYHWAAVIFVAGSDRVVLEASADTANYHAKKPDWEITTYGTEKVEQTFHHAWKGKLGTDEHTVRMTSSLQPPADIDKFETMSVPELIARFDEQRGAADTLYVTKELMRRDAYVKVTGVTASEHASSDTDEVSLWFGAGTPLGRTARPKKIKAGESDTFRMSVRRLWPQNAAAAALWSLDSSSLEIELSVEAWPGGTLPGARAVQDFVWNRPYVPSEITLEGEGGKYHLDMQMK